MARVVVLASLPESLVNFRRVLLHMLVAAQHDVVAVAPSAPECERLLATMRVGYRAVELNRNRVDPASDLRYLYSLYRVFREVRPEVVLAYTLKPVAFGGLAARLCGNVEFSALITGRGQLFVPRPGILAPCLRRVAVSMLRSGLRGARSVFFQNEEDLSYFLSAGLTTPGQARRISGSGVELDRFRPMPLPSRTSFLMLSRLIREKGVFEYVEAARLVKQSHPGIECKLAGMLEHGRSAVTQEQLADWHREGAVEYLGALDDVRAAIAAATVVVLPSFYPEGVPRSLLEALAMGRPVITTDTPGCRETVDNGSVGRLVPPRDSPALAAAMLEFVTREDLALQMTARCRQFCEERFDAKVVSGQILEGLGLA